MTPDMKRLCERATEAHFADGTAFSPNPDLYPEGMEAIVRAVLLALREATGETERYAAGEWSRRNVEAMVSDILADPVKA